MSLTINRLDKLKAFLSFLNNNNIININKIKEDSEEGFINRLKIQKCVYLARYYGLDLGYEYDMYIYGPYSLKLAEDYYSIEFKDNNRYMLEFKSNKFLASIKNSPEWLEVAATLLDLYETYSKDREKIIKRVYTMKTFTIDYINNVYEDLKRLGLIKENDP